MRKKSIWKKAATLSLAAITAAGMLTGCGGGNADSAASANNGGGNTAGAAGSGGGTNQAGADGYVDYSDGFAHNVTIKIPVYDRGFEGWDPVNNYYTKWIQQEFGDKYNITVQYVSVNRQNEVADFMQMIAAGNAPDIIFHYDMPQAVNYYSEGAMQELDLAEVAYYAPDYYEKLGGTIETYGNLDGKNTFFFAGRNAIYYNWVTLIRQDWLDQVGMEKPTNREELEDVARAWKEAGLGTIGDQLINKSYTYQYPFIGAKPDESDLALYLDLNVAPLTWEASENYLRYYNKEYNEGILDQEFYLNNDDAAWKADFVAGNVGIYSFYIAANTEVISSLKTNDPNAEVAVISPSAKAPADSFAYYYKYPPYGLIMGINSKTGSEERAAIWMFMDWMIQPENLFLLQNGTEGENYTLDADGIAVPVADYSGELKLSNNNNKDYWSLVAELADYGDDEKNFKANLKILAPAGYEHLIEDSYQYDKEVEQYGLVTPIFTKSVASTSEYAVDLTAMWQEFYVDLVTCKPEEFDVKYEAYCKEYLDNGYQEILDEKRALIEAGDYIVN